jgi:hypothetical protein
MFDVDPHMVNYHQYEFPQKFVAVAKSAKIGQFQMAIAEKVYLPSLSFFAWR